MVMLSVMNFTEASKIALKGNGIAHRDFDSGRWVTILEVGDSLEVFDSASPSWACLSSLVSAYGHDGWRSLSEHEYKKIGVSVESSEASSYIDLTYLSDQIEEVADLLSKVLELADKKVEK